MTERGVDAGVEGGEEARESTCHCGRKKKGESCLQRSYPSLPLWGPVRGVGGGRGAHFGRESGRCLKIKGRRMAYLGRRFKKMITKSIAAA